MIITVHFAIDRRSLLAVVGPSYNWWAVQYGRFLPRDAMLSAVYAIIDQDAIFFGGGEQATMGQRNHVLDAEHISTTWQIQFNDYDGVGCLYHYGNILYLINSLCATGLLWSRAIAEWVCNSAGQTMGSV